MQIMHSSISPICLEGDHTIEDDVSFEHGKTGVTRPSDAIGSFTEKCVIEGVFLRKTSPPRFIVYGDETAI